MVSGGLHACMRGCQAAPSFYLLFRKNRPGDLSVFQCDVSEGASLKLTYDVTLHVTIDCFSLGSVKFYSQLQSPACIHLLA